MTCRGTLLAAMAIAAVAAPAGAQQIAREATIASDPRLGEAHNNLAVVYLQAGRIADAEREVALAEKSGFRVNPRFKEDLKKASPRR